MKLINYYRLNEAQETPQNKAWENLKVGSRVKILVGRYRGQEGVVNNWHDTDFEEGTDEQLDVVMPDGKMRYFQYHQLELMPSEVHEGQDLTELPEDVLNDIKKNIRKGAKDLKQHWVSALEILHKAYEVSGVQRPTPLMKGAWKQYEDLIAFSVQELVKTRGLEGDWRTTL